MTFKTISASCKFCGIPLKLQCAIGYDDLRDPSGLVKMVACNHCADLHTEKSKLEDSIKRNALWIGLNKKHPKFNDVAEKLRTRCRKYCMTVSATRNLPSPAHDSEMPEQIIESPENVLVILKRYESALPYRKRTTTTAQSQNLPHKD